MQHDELEISRSQICKDKIATVLSNFFAKVEGKEEFNWSQSVTPRAETDAKIKFEFGAGPVNDKSEEESPKTPEFSEIAETTPKEKTIV